MATFRLFVVLATFCTTYGAEYDTYDLISTGICKTRQFSIIESLYPRKELRTLLDSKRGAVFEQSWNSSSFKRFSECKFTLQPPPDMGLYLMVRKLNLRRDAKGNCVDTVTVKQSNDKKTRFCYTPKDVPRSFSDPQHLRITIKLDHYQPLPTVDDTLQIQLVVTPKGSCFRLTQVRCDLGDSTSCIDHSFYQDRTVNCPNCVDEDECSTELEKVYVTNNQNIALTALVSLIFTMAVFAFCLLCLYKHRRCVSSCSSHSADSASSGGSGTRALRHNVATGVHTVELQGSLSDIRPSAPPMEEKDLPPSYDALFPTEVASSGSGPPTVSAATSPTIPKALDER
ncbi:uncharacterized protein LOC131208207 isoform X1 [Anopheles bellator]|uniref:uncharacterized protein LOC131208207 isoform X1 n=1 Tax=Anopheles bellator TaxID=139047 RepID=UPI00264A22F8|nr:uncharacterized protein LOC131208207 isoform X1 [Anopheles bellator]